MHRRQLLSGAAAIIPIATAGCTGDGGGTGTATDGGEPTDSTGTPAETTAGLSSVTLTPRESCPDPGGATIRLDADPVSVVGCVIGKNGCTVPRLTDVDYDAETRALTVVIAAVEERAEGEACTEALVNLGYEVRIDYDDPPTSVTVVHDDVDGRRTVADATR